MISLFLFVVFLLCAGLLWLQGLWNNLVNLINVHLAIFISLNYYEPISQLIENSAASYSYLIDFLMMWLLFGLSLGFLRLFSDLIGSRERVVFSMPVEMAGRSIMAIWVAWVFVGFLTLTLHTAPLGAHPFGGFQRTPNSGNFFGLAPDRQLLGLAQMASRGSLSRGERNPEYLSDHPRDSNLNVRVFDPQSEFILKHYARRNKFEGEAALRVN